MANLQFLPIEVVIILLGAAAVALLWLALRFGRTIARAVLVLGGLVLAILVAGFLLTQAAANYQAAKAAADAVSVARASTTGLTVILVLGALLVGALGALTLGALGIAGYAVLRWRLPTRARVGEGGDLPRWMQRRRLPSSSQPIIYVVEDEPAPSALPTQAGLDVDLAEWGW
jgi:hypothetical protein